MLSKISLDMREEESRQLFENFLDEMVDRQEKQLFMLAGHIAYTRFEKLIQDSDGRPIFYSKTFSDPERNNSMI